MATAPVTPQFTIEPPNQGQPSSGFSVEAPSASGQPAQSPEDVLGATGFEQMGGGEPSGVEDIGAGFLKGAESTAAGVSKLIHKVPVIGPKIIPQAGLTAMQKQAEPTNAPQWIGYGGETLTEFLLGDEALKGLSVADKLLQASKVAKIFEGSPRIMKALQMGADISKAQTELGPAEREAIKKSPILARLVGVGMDAIRQGTVQATQTGVKTGGDIGAAVKEGGTMAGVSAALGAPAAAVGGALERAGKLGQTLETAKKGAAEAETIAKGAEVRPAAAEATAKPPLIEAPAAGVVPEHKEIASGAAQAVNKIEENMHGSYDEGIKQISSELEGKTIALDGSPLAQAAKEARADLAQEPKGLTKRLGKSLQGMIPGTERGEKMVGTLLGEEKKSDVTPSWLMGEEVKGEEAAAPKPEAMTVDNLINYRQRLTKMLPQMSYDDPNKPVLYKLVNGVDDTIQKMADESGSPEVSKSYKDLRGQYKDQVQYFNSASAKAAGNPLRYQVAQKLQSETLNDAPQYLLGGNNSLAKVRAAKDLLGKESMDNLSVQTIRRWAEDSMNPDTGKLNAKKLIDQWSKVPADTRNEFFSQAHDAYHQMVSDLSKSPEVNKDTLASLQKLIRFGIFPATGALIGYEGAKRSRADSVVPAAEYWGALAGMLYGGGRREAANDLVKYMSEHPGMFSDISKAAQLAKPATKAISPAVKQQAAQSLMGKSSLANVYGGAEQPLGEEIQSPSPKEAP